MTCPSAPSGHGRGRRRTPRGVGEPRAKLPSRQRGVGLPERCCVYFNRSARSLESLSLAVRGPLSGRQAVLRGRPSGSPRLRFQPRSLVAYVSAMVGCTNGAQFRLFRKPAATADTVPFTESSIASRCRRGMSRDRPADSRRPGRTLEEHCSARTITGGRYPSWTGVREIQPAGDHPLGLSERAGVRRHAAGHRTRRPQRIPQPTFGLPVARRPGQPRKQSRSRPQGRTDS
jgi:hypothetical protein